LIPGALVAPLSVDSAEPEEAKDVSVDVVLGTKGLSVSVEVESVVGVDVNCSVGLAVGMESLVISAIEPEVAIAADSVELALLLAVVVAETAAVVETVVGVVLVVLVEEVLVDEVVLDEVVRIVVLVDEDELVDVVARVDVVVLVDAVVLDAVIVLVDVLEVLFIALVLLVRVVGMIETVRASST
jgi:hypothetical protein